MLSGATVEGFANIHYKHPPVAPHSECNVSNSLPISPLLQLTFDVQIMYIFISFGKRQMFVNISLNFNCIQLRIVFALKMFVGAK